LSWDKEATMGKKKEFIPYFEELEVIADMLAVKWGLDLEEKVELLDQLKTNPQSVRVVRGYISDGPGFVGDIFFIVFGGGPEYHVVIGNYKPAKRPGTWDFYPSEITKEGG